MVEFNGDGSIKLPERIKQNKEDKENRLKTSNCILIKKNIASFKSPKKCNLDIKLSKRITDNRFIDTIYKYFRENSQVPSKIIKINEKEFRVEIGTHFRRCSDCTNLIKRFKEFLYDNLIEENGNCTYESNMGSKNFCYEDYFE